MLNPMQILGFAPWQALEEHDATHVTLRTHGWRLGGLAPLMGTRHLNHYPQGFRCPIAPQ